MQFKQKLVYIALGVLLVFAGQFALYLVTNNATADQHEKQGNTIKHHRTIRISSGQTQQAMLLAKEITEYVNKTYPQTVVTVYTEEFGNLGTIHWFADYKDLATLERVRAQILADEGYGDLIGKATDLFIEGSGHDTLMISIP